MKKKPQQLKDKLLQAASKTGCCCFQTKDIVLSMQMMI
jgi:hypothetical protein